MVSKVSDRKQLMSLQDTILGNKQCQKRELPYTRIRLSMVSYKRETRGYPAVSNDADYSRHLTKHKIIRQS